MLAVLKRRHSITDAVFVFDGGMSRRLNLEALEENPLEFVKRLSKSTLSSLLQGLHCELYPSAEPHLPN
jgi:hypothetical protein